MSTYKAKINNYVLNKMLTNISIYFELYIYMQNQVIVNHLRQRLTINDHESVKLGPSDGILLKCLNTSDYRLNDRRKHVIAYVCRFACLLSTEL